MERLSVRNAFYGAPVYYLPDTDSTMHDARSLLRDAAASGTVVVADHQRRGRGRFAGRAWTANPGENLLFTVALAADTVALPTTRLPLVAGLAVARSLESRYDLRPRLKWPNDVLLDGGKVAGVLCQGIPGWFLVGVGINCNQDRFPAELNGLATSLSRTLLRCVDRFVLLEAVLTHLAVALADPEWRAAVDTRLWRVGERVTVAAGDPAAGEHVSGTVLGIGGAGELRLATESGERAVYAGELTQQRSHGGYPATGATLEE